jgi:hypothetical protein
VYRYGLVVARQLLQDTKHPLVVGRERVADHIDRRQVVQHRSEVAFADGVLRVIENVRGSRHEHVQARKLVEHLHQEVGPGVVAAYNGASSREIVGSGGRRARTFELDLVAKVIGPGTREVVTPSGERRRRVHMERPARPAVRSRRHEAPVRSRLHRSSDTPCAPPYRTTFVGRSRRRSRRTKVQAAARPGRRATRAAAPSPLVHPVLASPAALAASLQQRTAPRIEIVLGSSRHARVPHRRGQAYWSRSPGRSADRRARGRQGRALKRSIRSQSARIRGVPWTVQAIPYHTSAVPDQRRILIV